MQYNRGHAADLYFHTYKHRDEYGNSNCNADKYQYANEHTDPGATDTDGCSNQHQYLDACASHADEHYGTDSSPIANDQYRPGRSAADSQYAEWLL